MKKTLLTTTILTLATLSAPTYACQSSVDSTCFKGGAHGSSHDMRDKADSGSKGSAGGRIESDKSRK